MVAGQERVRTGVIEIRKVHGVVDPADFFTKHLECGKNIEQLIGMLNCQFRRGRPAAGPRLKRAVPTVSVGSPGGADGSPAAVVVDGLLLHLHGYEEIDEEFPLARPLPETHGEEDVLPEREFGDPVPGLSSRAPAARGPKGEAKIGRRVRTAGQDAIFAPRHHWNRL